jgi:LysM repeat protein
MRNLSGIVVSIVALIALGAATIGILPADTASLISASPTPTATSAADAKAGGEAAVPPKAPRVAPSPVVIYGIKDFSEVSFQPAYLTAWSLNPVTTTIGSSNGLTLSWTSLAGPNGSANLMVTPLSTSTVSAIGTITESTPPKIAAALPTCGQTISPLATTDTGGSNCYRIGVTNRLLGAGQYEATLYVSDQTGTETTVPVTLLIGRPFLILILTVALGVIGTEFWWQWRKSWRFRYSWYQYRQIWLGWLTREQNWVRFGGNGREKAEREALRAIRAEMSKNSAAIAEWLAQLQTGQLVIGHISAASDSIARFTDPLLDAGRRYLKVQNGWREVVEGPNGLEVNIKGVCTQLSKVSEQHRTQAKAALTAVYDSNNCADVQMCYRALENIWKSATLPSNSTLDKAWGMSQEVNTRLTTLKEQWKKLPGPDTTDDPAIVAICVDALDAHVNALKNDVIAKAREQYEAVKWVAGVPGRDETLAFISAVQSLDLTTVERGLERAKAPLKFADSGTELTIAVNALQQILGKINRFLAVLKCNDLSDDAVAAVMLAPLQQSLGEIDAKLNDKSANLPALWAEIEKAYGQQDRRVRLGRKLASMQANPETAQEFAPRLGLAYQYLLQGKLLDAEVEIERTRSEILRERQEPAQASAKAAKKPERRLQPKLLPASLVALVLLVFAVVVFLSQVSTPSRLAMELPPAGGPALATASSTPVPGAVTPSSQAFITHTVQSSETLTSISRIYNVPIFTIAAMNGITNPNTLYPGMVLIIPIEAPPVQEAPVDLLSIIVPMFLVILGGMLVLLFIPETFKVQRLVEEWRKGDRPKVPRADRLSPLFVALGRALMTVVWGLLSLAIAVTLIIAAREAILKTGLNTWGSNLDILVAFTWGAVAQRVIQSLQSNFGAVEQWIKGEKSV